jgi:hypothetical protein
MPTAARSHCILSARDLRKLTLFFGRCVCVGDRLMPFYHKLKMPGRHRIRNMHYMGGFVWEDFVRMREKG